MIKACEGFTTFIFEVLFQNPGATLLAQTVKNPSAMQVTQVQSLGWEYSLGKRMATHSNILAWENLQTEKPGRLQSMGSQRVRHDRATNTHTSHVHFQRHNAIAH